MRLAVFLLIGGSPYPLDKTSAAHFSYNEKVQNAVRPMFF